MAQTEIAVEHPLRVERFGALVRVAESSDLPIVHVRGETADRYLVFDGPATYCYTVFRREARPQIGSEGEIP